MFHLQTESMNQNRVWCYEIYFGGVQNLVWCTHMFLWVFPSYVLVNIWVYVNTKKFQTVMCNPGSSISRLKVWTNTVCGAVKIHFGGVQHLVWCTHEFLWVFPSYVLVNIWVYVKAKRCHTVMCNPGSSISRLKVWILFFCGAGEIHFRGVQTLVLCTHNRLWVLPTNLLVNIWVYASTKKCQIVTWSSGSSFSRLKVWPIIMMLSEQYVNDTLTIR